MIYKKFNLLMKEENIEKNNIKRRVVVEGVTLIFDFFYNITDNFIYHNLYDYEGTPFYLGRRMIPNINIIQSALIEGLEDVELKFISTSSEYMYEDISIDTFINEQHKLYAIIKED